MKAAENTEISLCAVKTGNFKPVFTKMNISVIISVDRKNICQRYFCDMGNYSESLCHKSILLFIKRRSDFGKQEYRF